MLEPGTTLLRKYRIELLLGRGGMGLVVKAHHLLLYVPVAMKLLLPQALEQQEVVGRFFGRGASCSKGRDRHTVVLARDAPSRRESP